MIFEMRILVLLLPLTFVNTVHSASKQSKKIRCLNPPTTAKKVETHIRDCQEEVKSQIVQEAISMMHENYDPYRYDSSHSSNDEIIGYSRYKRSSTYHPTLVADEDKRIAGCLLHCVYAKNNAIDKLGWPTLDGLVHFYSDGVSDHSFFMATLRASSTCLAATLYRYRINRLQAPKKGESCDLAFDVFDCISDQITEYCFDQYPM